MAEMLVQRLLREGSLRTQEADLQRLLLGQAGRHDFAEQPQQHFVVERALIAVENPAQHLGFAFGPVVVDRGLQRPLGAADLVGPARAFGDQLLDLAVDAVDAFTHLRQVGRRRGLAGAGFSGGHVRRGAGRSRP